MASRDATSPKVSHAWPVWADDGSDERVNLGHGLTAPAHFSITVEGPDYSLEIECGYEGGIYGVRKLEYAAHAGAVGVESEQLRRLPLKKWLADGLATMPLLPEGPQPVDRNRSHRVDPPKSLAEPYGADQKWVAIAYRTGVLLGQPPTAHVASRYGVSRATAGRWIAAARGAGALGPARQSRVGEQRPHADDASQQQGTKNYGGGGQ